MNITFQNNQLFHESLRGPQSSRKNRPNSCRRTRPLQASIHLDLSQLTYCDNSLAESAIRSISRERNSLQVQPHISFPINYENNKRTSLKKSTLMKKSSNLYKTFYLPDNKNIILSDHTKDQADVILQYLPETQIFLNKETSRILQSWIPTLPQEERKQIEIHKKYFPVPRNIPYHEVISGLNSIYGIGKERRLWPGEEALLMETIRAYIQQIKINPKLLLHSVSYTLQQIIKIANLEELLQNKICMLQLECHWKMMATRFRYSGQSELQKKTWQHWLEQAQLRGHFLNLSNDNLLTQYLLKHQKE